MFCLDVDFDGDGLAGSVLLDVVGVVFELQAFAETEVAFGGREVFLRGADLGELFDGAVGVGGEVVEDLFAADGFHGGADGAGWWRGDDAVGGGEGEEGEGDEDVE